MGAVLRAAIGGCEVLIMARLPGGLCSTCSSPSRRCSVSFLRALSAQRFLRSTYPSSGTQPSSAWVARACSPRCCRATGHRPGAPWRAIVVVAGGSRGLLYACEIGKVGIRDARRLARRTAEKVFVRHSHQVRGFGALVTTETKLIYLGNDEEGPVDGGVSLANRCSSGGVP